MIKAFIFLHVKSNKLNQLICFSPTFWPTLWEYAAFLLLVGYQLDKPQEELETLWKTWSDTKCFVWPGGKPGDLQFTQSLQNPWPLGYCDPYIYTSLVLSIQFHKFVAKIIFEKRKVSN